MNQLFKQKRGSAWGIPYKTINHSILNQSTQIFTEMPFELFPTHRKNLVWRQQRYFSKRWESDQDAASSKIWCQTDPKIVSHKSDFYHFWELYRMCWSRNASHEFDQLNYARNFATQTGMISTSDSREVYVVVLAKDIIILFTEFQYEMQWFFFDFVKSTKTIYT